MIFVDTSAIFALADGIDARHDEATRAFDALLRTGRRLFTHSYVLVESMALLQRRLGRAAFGCSKHDVIPPASADPPRVRSPLHLKDERRAHIFPFPA